LINQYFDTQIWQMANDNEMAELIKENKNVSQRGSFKKSMALNLPTIDELIKSRSSDSRGGSASQSQMSSSRKLASETAMRESSPQENLHRRKISVNNPPIDKTGTQLFI
jgi:hypothetical protein